MSRSCFQALGASLLISVLALPLQAGIIRVPAAVGTIESALDSAMPRDTVLVSPGYYYLQRGLVFNRPSVVLQSEVPRQAWIIADQLWVEPAVVHIKQDSCVVQGFHIYCRSWRVLEISHYGGGGPGPIRGVRIQDNSIDGASGWAEGIADGGTQGTSILDNDIVGCFGYTLGAGGGGPLAVGGLDFRVEGNHLLGNYGVGIWVLGGGGVLRGNTVGWTRAYQDDGLPDGAGGVQVENSIRAVLIENNTFEHALCDGWNASQGQGMGGGIRIVGSDSVVVSSNRILGNEAALGAGIYAENSNVTVRGNLISANRDSSDFAENQRRGYGGAMYLKSCRGWIEGNTMVGNVARRNGGALDLRFSPGLHLDRNIFAANRSDSAGVVFHGPAPAEFSCNDAWENGAWNYSGWIDPTGWNGNISLDPEFCQPDSGDFRLRDGSPCLPGGSPPTCGQIGAYGGCGIASVSTNRGGSSAHSFELVTSPNPSAAGVTIRYRSDIAVTLTFDVFDCSGRRVRSLRDMGIGADYHEVFWDGRDDVGRSLAAGIYLARVSGAAGTQTARVVILK